MADRDFACGMIGNFTACGQPSWARDDDRSPGQACIVSDGPDCNGRPSGPACVNLCQA